MRALTRDALEVAAARTRFASAEPAYRLDEGLPAILPVVLHNGSTRWRAAQDLGSLQRHTPPGLEKYSANLRYVCIDEGSYDDAVLAQHNNLVASLFRLEQCRDVGRVELLLPQSVCARVSAARPDELERWGERLFEVSCLSELFAEE